MGLKDVIKNRANCPIDESIRNQNDYVYEYYDSLEAKKELLNKNSEIINELDGEEEKLKEIKNKTKADMEMNKALKNDLENQNKQTEMEIAEIKELLGFLEKAMKPNSAGGNLIVPSEIEKWGDSISEIIRSITPESWDMIFNKYPDIKDTIRGANSLMGDEEEDEDEYDEEDNEEYNDEEEDETDDEEDDIEGEDLPEDDDEEFKDDYDED
jgi:hypothetical protein